MYEELVKNLRENVKDGCSDCTETAPLILQAADAIEELQGRARVLEKIADKWCNAVPKWIPVTERLPDKWERVITYDKYDGVTQNHIAGDNRSWCFGYHVTHWMPLPQPPESEGEK